MSYNALDVLEKIRKKVCIHCFKVQDQCSCGHFETELEDDGLSKYALERRKRAKQHRCTTCGKKIPIDRTSKTCESCVKKEVERRNRIREQRIKNKECVKCGIKIPENCTHTLCDNCIQNKKKHNNRQKIKEKIKSRYNQRKKEGKCPRCGEVLPQDSPHVYCEPCYEKHKKALEKFYKKKLANVQA